MKDLTEIKEKVVSIARQNMYVINDWQPEQGTIIFTSGAVKIVVYLTTMTVATCISHPKKGKTQLFRKNVSFEQLFKLFKNPRTHTGKGYYEKR